ncbi:carbohydrate ABC transporter permease [Dictyobacter formicarum]|uniref:Sn-glycerol-3-phosphate transport system permease protein UgpE n=1 Tax=Dictyobacter formicarum TaxID=2778368 RepID=A0ABQ3VER2_9CHLR|nr:carbohydrate ABC transporter permease [Dictyobacter formicarum]GHO84412.1 sn-glycerol-3-phosphate transport system permease protein UgpE [Dictyobacter formicarum]
MASTTHKKAVLASLPRRTSYALLFSSGRRAVWRVLNYLVMILLALFFLFPLIFMVVSSLKASETQILQDMGTIRAVIPYGSLSLQNYSDVFQRTPFALYLLNTLFIVICIVVSGLIVNSLIAYALARISFTGHKIILVLVVVLITIPFESVAVPLLLLVNQVPWFGGMTTWVDSYQVQIVPFIADAFSIFLFYQSFMDIPRDFEEAARVDGASRLRMYWQIILPLSRPAFATVAIWLSLTHLDDFLWPLLATRGYTYRPLMVGMRAFFNQAPQHWGDIMAFASMSTVPVLIAFILLQRWFLRSAISTGIKG